jgi:hypothetical protein
LLDLSFRDETNTVLQKYRKGRQKLETHGEKKQPQTYVDLVLPYALIPPIHEMAMGHFVNSFVAGSHFDYLPNMYSNTFTAEPLQLSTYAAAIANLARERREPELMKCAQSFYGRALTQTKAALLSNDVHLDTTLVSVLVLSLYETIALDGQKSDKSWNTHTEGATTLLQLRGVETLKTDMGQKLYIQVSNNIRVSCVQRAVPLPSAFVELDRQASVYLDPSNPVLQFWPIVDAFIELQVMENSMIREPKDLIKQALKLERMLVEICSNLSESGVYEVLDTETNSPEAFQNSVHWYLDHRVARLWNTIRMTRIYVNETLYEQTGLLVASQCLTETSLWPALREKAAETAQDAALGILASVPQFIRKPEGKIDSQRLKVSTVSGFVWPLSAVGGSKLLSQEARDYAVETLFIIGHEARLQPATMIAEILKKNPGRIAW